MNDPCSSVPPFPLRILIADDHPLLVDGLCSLLEAHGFAVVGTVDNGQAAVSEALRLEPDLVLMDIRMPLCDGLTATRIIKARQPEVKILVITTSAEDEDLFEAIKSGACGYLLKSTRGPDFIEALRGLEKGIPPFSPGLAERLLREFSRLSAAKEAVEPSIDSAAHKNHQAEEARLSERQMEVLGLVASGMTYKEVALRLSLSEITVRYHMGEIMRLLHLENRSQVIAYAGRSGMTAK